MPWRSGCLSIGILSGMLSHKRACFINPRMEDGPHRSEGMEGGDTTHGNLKRRHFKKR
jgi:hypothetical protein